MLYRGKVLSLNYYILMINYMPIQVEKYEKLLKGCVKAQTVSNGVSKSLLKVAEKLENNTRNLNDNFVLHAQANEQMYKEVAEIKKTLLKWIKVLAILLFAAVGGASVIKILGIDLSNLI